MPDPRQTAPLVTEPHRHVGVLGVSVSDHDESRWLTVVTAIGLSLAAVLAIIGNTPFDVPMPSHAFGWVTPTCGLTRGSTALARGDLGRAWDYNPASLLVAAFALASIGRSLLGWTTGRWLTLRCRPTAIGWALIGIAVVVLWANQQSHADFVIHSRF